MKKIVIIICTFIIVSFLYSNENNNSQEKNEPIKYFKISKVTRNLSIGLSFPGMLISESFFIQYYGIQYYSRKYKNRGIEYEETNDKQVLELANLEKSYSDILTITSWTSLSLGLSISFTSILLSIISNFYEKKAVKMSHNKLSDIPNKLMPWPIFKKILTCGLIFGIDGALMISMGIISVIVNNYVKSYTDLDAGENEAYPIIISSFIMGGIFSFMSFAFLIPGNILKWRKKVKTTTLVLSPLLDFSMNYGNVGIRIQY